MIKLDTWFLDNVFQPIINLIWLQLGINRRMVIRVLACFMSFSGYTRYSWLTVICSIAFFAITFLPNTSLGKDLFLASTRIFYVVFALITAIFDLGNHSIDIFTFERIAFLLFIYFVEAHDPPKGKRKDWKAAWHKFSEAWTWIPAPEKT